MVQMKNKIKKERKKERLKGHDSCEEYRKSVTLREKERERVCGEREREERVREISERIEKKQTEREREREREEKRKKNKHGCVSLPVTETRMHFPFYLR